MVGWKVALASAFLPSLAAAATSSPDAPASDVARVEYELGSDFMGHAEGTCNAAALWIPRGSSGAFEFEAHGGQWTYQVREYNVTVVEDPTGPTQALVLTDELHETRMPLAAGRGRIEWPNEGRVDLYAMPGPRNPNTPLVPVAFEADGFSIGKVLNRLKAATFYVNDRLGLVGPVFSSLEGPIREVNAWNGSFTLSGNLTLFLQQATLTTSDGGVLRLPPREDVTVVASIPGAAQVQHGRVHYAFLDLVNARVSVPAEGVQLFCRDLEADLDGTLHAYGARGVLARGAEQRAFDHNELTLEGLFHWTERAQAHRVNATGVGQIHAAELDFVAVLDQPSQGLLLVKAGLWASLLAAVGTLLYYASKAFFPFFSRLTYRQVSDHPTRRLMLEVIRYAPNVNLRSLAAQVGVSKSEVRYHALILESRGLLRSHHVGRDRCFVAQETLKQEGRVALSVSPKVVSQNDPVVGALLEEVPQEGIRLNALLRTVAERLGVSKVGVWKAVHRAQRYGFVSKDQVGREVWVRCVA